MSELNQEQNMQPKKQDTGLRWAMPFLITLAVLTVVSFIIPLRPTQSMSEKRNLAEFPEFSVDALLSGDYFDDITLWFSDTFPGRETWLDVSSFTGSLHGWSEISIQGDLPVMETVPEIPEVYIPPETTEPPTTEEAELSEETEETAEPEPTEEEGWGGVNAGEEEIMLSAAAIQIGNSVYSAQGFSQVESNNYIAAVNKFYEEVKDLGVRIISAPPPTAIGILIEEQYLEQVNCASQDKILNYLHSGMHEDIVKVDTVNALIAHNDEYIYFRTDHHWTALGAYYSYEAVCLAAGMEPKALQDFEEWYMGDFTGSLFGKAQRPYQLEWDTVTAYIPEGDLEHWVYNKDGFGYEWQLLTDTSNWDTGAKYSVFGTDYPMTHTINHSLPEGKNAVVIKDSFGNCFVPFITQNYKNVYALDYRKFRNMPLTQFVEQYEIDDVIFMPYLTATQAIQGTDFIENLCF